MCIVLFTTAHPDYALVLIDNRDEYILRPTSRPHWWKHPTSGNDILSSRDLQRAAKGTWLGISKNGTLAVLTNYREASNHDPDHPICGVKSRGNMVNAWLGGLPDSGVRNGVHTLVKDGGVKGVGGFSMVCGKLRRKSEGIAIVSNRAGDPNDVPMVGLARGEVWGLSNTVYTNSLEWPKVQAGKRLLTDALSEAVSNRFTHEELVAKLFSVLDTDTLPKRLPGMTAEDQRGQLRHSIFVPAFGDEADFIRMKEAMDKGRADWTETDGETKAAEEITSQERPDATPNPVAMFEEGLYGTQRQTVLLVDWEGKVTFVERALWDANGNAIPRGEGDVTFGFTIDGWEE